MRNLTLLTDLYELTMMYGYYRKGMHKTQVVFDLFFRKPQNGTTYAVMAGLEQAIDYINNICFDESNIEYLRSLNLFDEEFLAELRDLHFSGEIYACLLYTSSPSTGCLYEGPPRRPSPGRTASNKRASRRPGV